MRHRSKTPPGPGRRQNQRRHELVLRTERLLRPPPPERRVSNRRPPPRPVRGRRRRVPPVPHHAGDVAVRLDATPPPPPAAPGQDAAGLPVRRHHRLRVQAVLVAGGHPAELGQLQRQRQGRLLEGQRGPERVRLGGGGAGRQRRVAERRLGCHRQPEQQPGPGEALRLHSGLEGWIRDVGGTGRRRSRVESRCGRREDGERAHFLEQPVLAEHVGVATSRNPDTPADEPHVLSLDGDSRLVGVF